MKTDLIDRYTIEHKEQDSQLTLLRDNATRQLVLMREIMVCTHEEYKNIVEALETERHHRHSNLLCLIDYEFVLEGVSESGPQRRALCFFEYSKYPLDLQISQRRQRKEYFLEHQLWEMLLSLVEVLAYLQTEGIAHGGISSSNVYIDQDTNSIKLCDPLMVEIDPSLEYSENVFYSPELLHSHTRGGDIQAVNAFKSDVFCLGMCMLEASLLETCYDCYHYQKGVLNYHLLKSKKIQLSQYYSEEYCSAIDLLQTLKADDRPDFIQLEEILRGRKLSGRFDWETQRMNSATFKERQSTKLLLPTQPEMYEDNSQEPILSIAPDVQYISDLQRSCSSENQQYQTLGLLKQTTRQFMKTGSYQSLASVRSVQSKQMHPTASESHQTIEHSIRECSQARQNRWNELNIRDFAGKQNIDWSNYVYNPSPHQLYTDPTLIQLIRQELNRMQTKRLNS